MKRKKTDGANGLVLLFDKPERETSRLRDAVQMRDASISHLNQLKKLLCSTDSSRKSDEEEVGESQLTRSVCH